MKILVITPHVRGGMVHYAAQMANALSKRADVVQITRSGVDRSLFADEVELHELDVPESVGELGPSTLRSLRTIRRLVTRGRVDVVHLTVRYSLFSLLLPTFARHPFVLTHHDVYAHQGEYSLRDEITARLMVWASDTVVVHGQVGADQFETKYGSGARVSQVMHGDYSFFRRFALDEPVRYERELLFFGRIQPYKGLRTLIEANERLAESDGDYRLTIAGNGEIDADLRDRIAASEHVTLKNEYIENREVARLFNRCRAVVLPYRDASYSGIVPIAYSFGKPVVATNVGGLPEVVVDGETGTLVDPQQPDQLAEACARLLDDPRRARRLGENGKAFSETHMDWETIAAQLLEIYEGITGPEQRQ